MSLIRIPGSQWRGGAVGLLAVLASCGGGAALPSDGTGQPPADGRCDLLPRKLVDASTYPVPASNGPVKVGISNIVASGPDLYYETYAIDTGSRELPYLAGGLLQVPVVGGPRTEIASGYAFMGLVVTDTSLIVARNNAVPNTDADDIVSIPRSNGPPTTLFTFDANDFPFAGPTTDGAFVYFSSSAGVRAVPLASPTSSIMLTSYTPTGVWAIRSRLVMTFTLGDVMALPLPPAEQAPVELLASGLGAGPLHLMTCGTNVCWLEGYTLIEKIDPLGGPVMSTSLPPSLGWIMDAVFDGSDFFVVGGSASTGAGDKIARVPSSGGSMSLLVTTSGGAAIAVDDECVYWSSTEGIFSLAKTARGPIAQ
jgi:hypothetical protein